jgi:hypothetical protein
VLGYLVNKEFGGMLKEVFWALFEVIFWYCIGETEENQE